MDSHKWIDKARIEKQRNHISDAQIAAYNQEKDLMYNLFLTYADMYIEGELSPSEIEELMQDALKNYYIRLALLGKEGVSPTDKELEEISAALAVEYLYLEGLKEDLEFDQTQEEENKFSDKYLLWRFGRYSFGWDRFVKYTMPSDLASALPALPGVDCLGGAQCGCQLEWEIAGDTINVYWLLDPFKTHCIVCEGLASEWSPLELLLSEL